jgi:hypothetical protein
LLRKKADQIQNLLVSVLKIKTGTKTIRSYFAYPEQKVFLKMKEPPNTDIKYKPPKNKMTLHFLLRRAIINLLIQEGGCPNCNALNLEGPDSSHQG